MNQPLRHRGLLALALALACDSSSSGERVTNADGAADASAPPGAGADAAGALPPVSPPDVPADAPSIDAPPPDAAHAPAADAAGADAIGADVPADVVSLLDTAPPDVTEGMDLAPAPDTGPTPCTQPPTITLSDAADLALDCGSAYVDPGSSAVDCHGQPVTVVLGASAVDTARPGTYVVSYAATDAAGLVGKAMRSVHVCGKTCGELGKEPISLTGWTPEIYEQNSQGDANWMVAAGGLSVTQTVNADASLFLSDFDATDFAIEGSWRMGTASDDDFVGFVFGYQDRGHFYLFDWKRGTQAYMGTQARAGMSLKVVSVTGAPDAGPIQLSVADLWSSEGTANVKPMEKNGAPLRNDVPWNFNTDYWFFVELHGGTFSIRVEDQNRQELAAWSVTDQTYKSGKFGFYNFSQGPVTYASFRKRSTPPACSTVAPGALSSPPGP